MPSSSIRTVIAQLDRLSVIDGDINLFNEIERQSIVKFKALFREYANSSNPSSGAEQESAIKSKAELLRDNLLKKALLASKQLFLQKLKHYHALSEPFGDPKKTKFHTENARLIVKLVSLYTAFEQQDNKLLAYRLMKKLPAFLTKVNEVMINQLRVFIDKQLNPLIELATLLKLENWQLLSSDARTDVEEVLQQRQELIVALSEAIKNQLVSLQEKFRAFLKKENLKGVRQINQYRRVDGHPLITIDEHYFDGVQQKITEILSQNLLSLTQLSQAYQVLGDASKFYASQFASLQSDAKQVLLKQAEKRDEYIVSLDFLINSLKERGLVIDGLEEVETYIKSVKEERIKKSKATKFKLSLLTENEKVNVRLAKMIQNIQKRCFTQYLAKLEGFQTNCGEVRMRLAEMIKRVSLDQIYQHEYYQDFLAHYDSTIEKENHFQLNLSNKKLENVNEKIIKLDKAVKKINEIDGLLMTMSSYDSFNATADHHNTSYRQLKKRQRAVIRLIEAMKAEPYAVDGSKREALSRDIDVLDELVEEVTRLVTKEFLINLRDHLLLHYSKLSEDVECEEIKPLLMAVTESDRLRELKAHINEHFKILKYIFPTELKQLLRRIDALSHSQEDTVDSCLDDYIRFFKVVSYIKQHVDGADWGEFLSLERLSKVKNKHQLLDEGVIATYVKQALRLLPNMRASSFTEAFPSLVPVATEQVNSDEASALASDAPKAAIKKSKEKKKRKKRKARIVEIGEMSASTKLSSSHLKPINISEQLQRAFSKEDSLLRLVETMITPEGKIKLSYLKSEEANALSQAKDALRLRLSQANRLIMSVKRSIESSGSHAEFVEVDRQVHLDARLREAESLQQQAADLFNEEIASISKRLAHDKEKIQRIIGKYHGYFEALFKQIPEFHGEEEEAVLSDVLRVKNHYRRLKKQLLDIKPADEGVSNLARWSRMRRENKKLAKLAHQLVKLYKLTRTKKSAPPPKSSFSILDALLGKAVKSTLSPHKHTTLFDSIELQKRLVMLRDKRMDEGRKALIETLKELTPLIDLVESVYKKDFFSNVNLEHLFQEYSAIKTLHDDVSSSKRCLALIKRTLPENCIEIDERVSNIKLLVQQAIIKIRSFAERNNEAFNKLADRVAREYMALADQNDHYYFGSHLNILIDTHSIAKIVNQLKIDSGLTVKLDENWNALSYYREYLKAIKIKMAVLDEAPEEGRDARGIAFQLLHEINNVIKQLREKIIEYEQELMRKNTFDKDDRGLVILMKLHDDLLSQKHQYLRTPSTARKHISHQSFIIGVEKAFSDNLLKDSQYVYLSDHANWAITQFLRVLLRKAAMLIQRFVGGEDTAYQKVAGGSKLENDVLSSAKACVQHSSVFTRTVKAAVHLGEEAGQNLVATVV